MAAFFGHRALILCDLLVSKPPRAWRFCPPGGAIADAKAEIKASEERARGFARDLQTGILTGLQQFARGNFARMHTLEGHQADINVRLAALEERVLYLGTRRRPQ